MARIKIVPSPVTLHRGDDADDRRQCMTYEQNKERSETTAEEVQVVGEVVNG